MGSMCPSYMYLDTELNPWNRSLEVVTQNAGWQTISCVDSYKLHAVKGSMVFCTYPQGKWYPRQSVTWGHFKLYKALEIDKRWGRSRYQPGKQTHVTLYTQGASCVVHTWPLRLYIRIISQDWSQPIHVKLHNLLPWLWYYKHTHCTCIQYNY